MKISYIAYFCNSIGNFSYSCNTINMCVKDMSCFPHFIASCTIGNWRDGSMDKHGYLDLSQCEHKNDELVQGWKDGSEVQSVQCSFRGSQLRLSTSITQLMPVTLFLEDLTASSSFHCYVVHVKSQQHTHTYINFKYPFF